MLIYLAIAQMAIYGKIVFCNQISDFRIMILLSNKWFQGNDLLPLYLVILNASHLLLGKFEEKLAYLSKKPSPTVKKEQ